MRTGGRRRAAGVLVAAGAVLCTGLCTTGPAAGRDVPPPAPTSISPAAAVSVPPAAPSSIPPAAPKPTDDANSPAAPDPHPPRGGLDAHGRAVGGARLLSRGTVLPPGAPDLPKDLTARAFAVVDLDRGTVLAARDPHGRYPAASIQKLLTSVTLLPRLPGSRVVTVTRQAADTEGSHAGLVAGGRYTVDQIFQGLLLVSGNDCAEALAEAAGGRRATVAMMNRTALHLGAADTFVQTPSGLDGWQQLTSAYDMALFLRAALDQPRFAQYDRLAKAYLPAQHAKDVDNVGKVPLWNQNEVFLTSVKGALVAKTGFTDAAQHTFAGAIERDGHRYGVILLRAQRYPDDQYVQATKLVNWATRLPSGTPAVGTLVPPPAARVATSPAPSRSATASGSTASGSAGVTAGVATRPAPSGSFPWWLLAPFALVVAAVALALTRRLRHH